MRPTRSHSPIACTGSLLCCVVALLAVPAAAADFEVTEILDAAGDGAGNPLVDPFDITVGPGGNVYVAGGFGSNAFRIAPDGTVTEIIDTTGDGAGNALVTCNRIAVGPNGNVYVTGGTSDNAFEITPGGTISQIIDASGDGSAVLDGAAGVDVDSSGNVYVVGNLSDNAFRIAPGGAITEIIDATGDGAGNGLTSPIDMAVDAAGNAYVSGAFSDNVFRITPGGAITEIIDATGDGAGNTLNGPQEIGIDSNGNVYVAAASSNAFRITPGGVTTEIIDPTGDGQGNTLAATDGLAVDANDSVYVAGFISDNAFRIDPDGTITEIMDATGDGAGNALDGPRAVAVDAGGSVYVVAQLSDNAFRIVDCRAPVVVPNAVGLAEAASLNTIPFGWPPPNNSFRYQQVFDAAEFPCAAQPRLLHGLRLRPDATQGPDAYALPLEIRLSTTSQAVDGLSATFADNPGADETVVYDGTFPLASAATGPPGGPRDFDIEIPFQAAFVYTPAAGNLLLEVRTPGGTNATSFRIDALPNQMGDPLSRAWSGDPAGATGTMDSAGVVVAFHSLDAPSPVPALRSWPFLLLALLVAAAGATARTHRRTESG